MTHEEHPEIPSGLYCYRILEVAIDEKGPHIKKELCPHWHKTEKGARCNLLNEEHHELCGWHLVWDQVKDCNINMDRDFEPHHPSDDSLKRDGFKLKTITCRCGKTMDVWQWHKHKETKESP